MNLNVLGIEYTFQVKCLNNKIDPFIRWNFKGLEHVTSHIYFRNILQLACQYPVTEIVLYNMTMYPDILCNTLGQELKKKKTCKTAENYGGLYVILCVTRWRLHTTNNLCIIVIQFVIILVIKTDSFQHPLPPTTIKH